MGVRSGPRAVRIVLYCQLLQQCPRCVSALGTFSEEPSPTGGQAVVLRGFDPPIWNKATLTCRAVHSWPRSAVRAGAPRPRPCRGRSDRVGRPAQVPPAAEEFTLKRASTDKVNVTLAMLRRMIAPGHKILDLLGDSRNSVKKSTNGSSSCGASASVQPGTCARTTLEHSRTTAR